MASAAAGWAAMALLDPPAVTQEALVPVVPLVPAPARVEPSESVAIEAPEDLPQAAEAAEAAEAVEVAPPAGSARLADGRPAIRRSRYRGAV